jgi:hypothetical protein
VALVDRSSPGCNVCVRSLLVDGALEGDIYKGTKSVN